MLVFRTSLAVVIVLICSGDVPLLLCIILRQLHVVSESAFKVPGKSITFGALLQVLYATPPAPFDFSVPICGPWAMGGPRILPEARKTGIPDGKSRTKELEKIRKTNRNTFKSIQNTLKQVEIASQHLENDQKPCQNS